MRILDLWSTVESSQSRNVVDPSDPVDGRSSLVVVVVVDSVDQKSEKRSRKEGKKNGGRRNPDSGRILKNDDYL